MSRTKKIINNSAFVFAARGIETLAGIVVTGMLARHLGVADYGAYSLVMALAWIAIPLIGMEIPRILAVKLSQDCTQEANHIGNGMSWNLLISLILVGGIWVAGFFFPEVSSYYFAGLAVAVLRTLTQTAGSIFIARERMAYDTYTSLIVTFHLIIFTAIVIWFDWGLDLVFYSTVLAYLTGFILTLLFYRHLTGLFPVPMIDLPFLKNLLLGSLAFSAIQLLDQLLIYCGAFLLNHQLGPAAAALFQAPMRIFTRFMIFPMALSVAILPGISQLVAAGGEKSELTRMTDAVLRSLLLAGMLLTIFAFITADELITLIFGKAFTDSIAGFKILVLSTLFYFVNQFYIILCVICNRVKGFGIIKMVEIAICFSLNILLIAEHGYIGSMWAIVISSGVTAFLGYFYFQDILRKESFMSLLFVTLSGFGVLTILQTMHSWHRLLALSAGITGFTGLMILFRIITLHDVRFLLNIIRPGSFRKRRHEK